MTIIELLVATFILLVASASMWMALNAGMIHLRNMQIDRAAAQCARMVMEYFHTIPAEKLYEWHKDEASEGDWLPGSFADAGMGFGPLNTFVSSMNTKCRDLSDTSLPEGAKVVMRYSLCPGCTSFVSVDAETLQETVTCEYLVTINVCYNKLAYGGNRCIEHKLQMVPSTSENCAEICGAAVVAPGEMKEVVKKCPDD